MKIKNGRINYWDINNIYGLEISQKLPVDSLEWVENTSQFNKDFIEKSMKLVMKNIFL